MAASLDYDAVLSAISEEFWKLAPRRYRENDHVDLVFEVTHQDLIAAVENGIENAAAEAAPAPEGATRP
jgi:hypothetical protein